MQNTLAAQRSNVFWRGGIEEAAKKLGRRLGAD